MSKIANTSTDTITYTKKRRVWTASTADALRQWALKPTSFLIQEFYTNRDMPKSTFYDAVADDPELKAAFDFAKDRIGVNMYKFGAKNNLTLNHVATYALPQFVDVIKAEQRNRAQLVQEQNLSAVESIKQAFQELMKPMPRTKLVKEK